MTTKRVALVDGDELAYKVGHLCQETFKVLRNNKDLVDYYFDCKQDAIEWLEEDQGDYWEIIELVLPRDPITVKFQLSRIIHFIKERTKCKEVEVYLTSDDKNNFRYKLATLLPYKGNREEVRRPYYWAEIRAHLMDEYNGVIETDCEADDGLSKAQYAYRRKKVHSCIVSQDKDLKMVPGAHFNIPKNELFDVTEEEAIKFFYKQLLVGDSTDNIYGIYRIGMTTADKMIESLNTTDEVKLWKYCLEQYQKALDDPKIAEKMPNPKMPLRERVTEIARLLWMQEYPQQLWIPPDER